MNLNSQGCGFWRIVGKMLKKNSVEGFKIHQSLERKLKILVFEPPHPIEDGDS